MFRQNWGQIRLKWWAFSVPSDGSVAALILQRKLCVWNCGTAGNTMGSVSGRLCHSNLITSRISLILSCPGVSAQTEILSNIHTGCAHNHIYTHMYAQALQQLLIENVTAEGQSALCKWILNSFWIQVENICSLLSALSLYVIHCQEAYSPNNK